MRFAGFFAIAALVFNCAFLTGCKSSGADSEKAMDSIVDTRVEVVKAQNDLTDTMMSLQNLQNASGDGIPAAYAKFEQGLANTQQHKERAEARATAMRQDEAAYQKKWEDETSMINNPDLKTSAEERVAHVREHYATIRDIANDCRQRYAVLYNDMADIKRYMASDMTSRGLEKAKPTIETARKDGDELNSRLNDLVAQMNKLTAEMNPAGKVPE